MALAFGVPTGMRPSSLVHLLQTRHFPAVEVIPRDSPERDDGPSSGTGDFGYKILSLDWIGAHMGPVDGARSWTGRWFGHLLPPAFSNLQQNCGHQRPTKERDGFMVAHECLMILFSMSKFCEDKQAIQSPIFDFFH